MIYEWRIKFISWYFLSFSKLLRNADKPAPSQEQVTMTVDEREKIMVWEVDLKVDGWYMDPIESVERHGSDG